MVGILRTVLKDRAFVISALILLVSAAGITSVAKAMKLHFRKLPVPLRKDLQEFDTIKLLPDYKLVGGKQRLPKEIEEQLGTDQYVQCLLEDTGITGEKGGGKYISFFVTYYTGGLDQVPHVPEECYAGGGLQQVGDRYTTVEVPGIGLENNRLRVRELFFQDPRTLVRAEKPVIYFFMVNGKFMVTRTDVRRSLGRLRLKYAYFSKVELSFPGAVPPDRDQALKLAGRFLAKALPILIDEHWPDRQEVTGRE